MAHATVKPCSILRQNMWAIFTNVACPLISVSSKALELRYLRYRLPKWISLSIDPSATDRTMGSYHFKKVVITRSGTIPGYVVFRAKAQWAESCRCFKFAGVFVQVHRPCSMPHCMLVLSISCQHDVIWEGARFHGNDGDVPAEDYSRLQKLSRVWHRDSACHAAVSCNFQTAQSRLYLSMMAVTQRHDM